MTHMGKAMHARSPELAVCCAVARTRSAAQRAHARCAPSGRPPARQRTRAQREGSARGQLRDR